MRRAIVLLTALFFILALVVTYRNSTAAFYFAPLRAWELLLGAIVSQHYIPSLRGALARNIASLAGLLCILLPAALYTATTWFPGIDALPPCAGACLILAAGETGSSLVGRLLSLRPVVSIGLISYSLYLWHWPLLVFQRLGQIFSPDLTTSAKPRLLVLAASLVMGTLSWHFVETPFRRGRRTINQRSMFLASAMAAVALCTIGTFLLSTRGLTQRFSPEVSAVAAYLKYEHDTLPGRYLLNSGDRSEPRPL